MLNTRTIHAISFGCFSCAFHWLQWHIFFPDCTFPCATATSFRMDLLDERLHVAPQYFSATFSYVRLNSSWRIMGWTHDISLLLYQSHEYVSLRAVRVCCIQHTIFDHTHFCVVLFSCRCNAFPVQISWSFSVLCSNLTRLSRQPRCHS